MIKYSVSTLPAGSYTGTITLQAEGTAVTQSVVVNLTVQPPPFAVCDFDQDHDVDMIDFGRFQACMTGPGVSQTIPACAGARLDDDDDVDQADVSRFLSCLGGADVVVNTSCSDQ